MIVRSISIRREGDFSSYTAPDLSKPFRATIEVNGTFGKIEMLLSADMSRRIVDIIAEEVAAAGRATAQAMTAECFNAPALEGPKAK